MKTTSFLRPRSFRSCTTTVYDFVHDSDNQGKKPKIGAVGAEAKSIRIKIKKVKVKICL